MPEVHGKSFQVAGRHGCGTAVAGRYQDRRACRSEARGVLASHIPLECCRLLYHSLPWACRVVPSLGGGSDVVRRAEGGRRERRSCQPRLLRFGVRSGLLPALSRIPSPPDEAQHLHLDLRDVRAQRPDALRAHVVEGVRGLPPYYDRHQADHHHPLLEHVLRLLAQSGLRHGHHARLERQGRRRRLVRPAHELCAGGRGLRVCHARLLRPVADDAARDQRRSGGKGLAQRRGLHREAALRHVRCRGAPAEGPDSQEALPAARRIARQGLDGQPDVGPQGPPELPRPPASGQRQGQVLRLLPARGGRPGGRGVGRRDECAPVHRARRHARLVPDAGPRAALLREVHGRHERRALPHRRDPGVLRLGGCRGDAWQRQFSGEHGPGLGGGLQTDATGPRESQHRREDLQHYEQRRGHPLGPSDGVRV
mmetsp:Transcript_16048/g.42397  ORF Transcript_16048/g.42397 Transcript_16048/m.42397 type:complete len:425 (-) Transcript_16048:520-1794(-)